MQAHRPLRRYAKSPEINFVVEDKQGKRDLLARKYADGEIDYLDGITARVTGQYSRLGALLDPLVDRLLVLAGVVVCWHFELLPRWGLALLAVREVLMLILVRVAMVKHVDLPVNWLGRAGVFPVFGALFFGLAGVDWLAQALLYVGLVLIYGSLARYVGAGLRQYRAQQG